MSQDIVGHIMQSVDHGIFISIPFKHGVWRVRESSILAYTTLDQTTRPDNLPQNSYILRLDIAGAGTIGLEFGTLGEMEKSAAQLDWHFKKERRESKS